jgi:hypothetical protein
MGIGFRNRWVSASQIVSVEPGIVSTRVLHIRPELRTGDSAEAITAALAHEEISIEAFTDVFRGLSRLLRTRADRIRAVLVCVDGVAASEFEFFAIANRLRPLVPVYVYGNPRAAARISRAIEFGASGPVTDELIAGLALSAAHPPVRPTTVSEPAVVTSNEEAVAGVAPMESEGLDATAEDQPDGIVGEPERGAVRKGQPPAVMDDSADDEAMTSPVRVPWLRDEDRPVRRGPGGSSPAVDDQREADSKIGRRSPSEPLLTEQELQALVGDDIASIAPDFRISSAPDSTDDVGDLP